MDKQESTLRNEQRYWRSPSLKVEFMKAVLHHHAYDRHTHDEFAIAVMERGVQQYYCQHGQNFALPTGLITINPDEVHDGCLASDSPHPFRDYRMMYVEPTVFEDLAKQLSNRNRSLPFFRVPYVKDVKLAHKFIRVHQLLDPHSDTHACPMEKETALLELLTSLMRQYLHHRPQVAALPPDEKRVLKAKAFMKDHMADKISLSDVSREVGLSTFHFLRIFRDRTGVPPHGYLTYLRLNQARALLRRGFSVGESSAMTGFADQSHMGRAFKRAFGMTPRRYVLAIR